MKKSYNAGFNLAVAQLKPEVRAKFDNEKAWAYFETMKGKP